MINLEWVKDYIDITDQDLEELAVKITQAGINIEKVITNHIDHLIIGEVIECMDHPDSDHLHVCKVNIGKGELQQIVCGAPNVRKGLKVIVSLPGAILPGNVEIKASKIRGVESNGMICALYELGLEEKTEETYKKGIHELDPSAPIGMDPMEYLGLNDTKYELDIHKHRNNDCYYHIGFAYEIAAILNRKVILPNAAYQTINDSIKDHITLEVETEKCPYYLAKMVTDVEIKESPEFIKRRLASVGMRSINNVVDISNYVMLEYGQPLHFFDKEKLGNKIVVRNAHENETITTLDGKERLLKESDILITDGKVPVAIAGVMGGLNTEISESTKTILIESAIFDPIQTRYTAARLNLKSEASIRYGKGLNEEYTEKALDRACHLLEKYANAKVLSEKICYDHLDHKEKIVEFAPSDVNRMLGIEIKEEEMKVELDRLDFPYTVTNGKLKVTIPKRRLDIDPYINDISEEIGRLYGYHNLVSTLPVVPIRRGKYVGDVKYRKMVSKRLRSLGLNEVKTYTLISPTMKEQFAYGNKEQVVLPNPMSSDKSIVRTSILPSLYQVYKYNKARKVEDILIYEISKTYDKNYQEESLVAGLLSGTYVTNGWAHPTKVDFYLLKGIVQNLLDAMGLKNRYTFEKKLIPDLHPGISASILLDRQPIGVIGRIHPSLCKEEVFVFELSLNSLMKEIKPLKFKEAPKYPDIKKDMAFIVSKEISAESMMQTMKKAGGRLLDEIKVFDVYEGPNIESDQKSIAFNLSFMDPTRTLTEEEVMEVFNRIIEKVTQEHQGILRDK